MTKEKTSLKKIYDAFSKEDLVILVLYKLRDKLVLRERRERTAKFRGNREDALELYRYYQDNGIKPVLVIDKGEYVSHIYEDGTRLNLKINLRRMPKREKKLVKVSSDKKD